MSFLGHLPFLESGAVASSLELEGNCGRPRTTAPSQALNPNQQSSLRPKTLSPKPTTTPLTVREVRGYFSGVGLRIFRGLELIGLRLRGFWCWIQKVWIQG